MTIRPTIGFVGLGTMGGPMARRLAASGYEVAGHDPSAERARQAAADEARSIQQKLDSLPDIDAPGPALYEPTGELHALAPSAPGARDQGTLPNEIVRQGAARFRHHANVTRATSAAAGQFKSLPGALR